MMMNMYREFKMDRKHPPNILPGEGRGFLLANNFEEKRTGDESVALEL